MKGSIIQTIQLQCLLYRRWKIEIEINHMGYLTNL
uniref:Uncharacterized protein n=1 Tax=Lepeophtheirus salmonis TaxID=72036 RepID=A0A0K2UKB9_LEPSM